MVTLGGNVPSKGDCCCYNSQQAINSTHCTLRKLTVAAQLSDYWKIGYSLEINEQFSVRVQSALW